MTVDVARQLEEAREQLLDLSARNRLLNFRPTKRTTVPIVGHSPDEIWQLLVVDGRTVYFLAREEQEESSAPGEAAGNAVPGSPADGAQQPLWNSDEREELTVFDLPGLVADAGEGDDEAKRGRARYVLQTGLDSTSLQTNLIRIHRAARAALEEKGVNLLFLAVGFLHWKPADVANRIFKAPVLLIPVEVKRASAGARFRLTGLDEEPVLNPCLAALLERDHRIRLPDVESEWEAADVQTFLEDIQKSVSALDAWEVASEVYLGFYSFRKYLMYLDLDPDRWLKERSLLEKPLVRVICGDRSAIDPAPEPPEARDLDRLIKPQDTYQVLDADSSQLRAIVAAKKGRSFVLIGPPGTGKSQTIANVIAECLSMDKTVLFVSEKMAALEVVKRRLDRVGLGDFCLELHSTKARRKTVTEELGRVLEKGTFRGSYDDTVPERLQQVRSDLSGYVTDLHGPLKPTDLTPYQAIGRIALLARAPDVFCEIPGVCMWDDSQALTYGRLVDRVAGQLEGVWPIDSNPWRGTRLRLLAARVQRDVQDQLRELIALLTRIANAGGALAEALRADGPGSVRGARRLLANARLVERYREVSLDLLRDPSWDEERNELRSLLSLLRQMKQVRHSLSDRYDLEAGSTVDWAGVLRRWKWYADNIIFFLRPAYWSDRKKLRLSRLPDYRPNAPEKLRDLHELAKFQKVRQEIHNKDSVGRRYLAFLWHGPDTDWEAAKSFANWVLNLRKRIEAGDLTWSGMESILNRPVELSELADPLHELLGKWAGSWGAFSQTLSFSEEKGLGAAVADTTIECLSDRLCEMATRLEDLHSWTQFQDALQDCMDGPIAGFVEEAIAARLKPADWVDAYEKQRHRLLLEEALRQRRALRGFSGRTHEADRERFAELDRKWLRATRVRLHAHLSEGRPSSGFMGDGSVANSSQLGILQGEIRRKRGGRPIRKLLSGAGQLIQALKPCFMMSPLSVAQFLEPGRLGFDVVVFDEASQVEPADALGAIARGSQLLLVGDPKQLPPTDFFQSMSGDAGAEEDDEGAAGLSAMESILDRGLMVLPGVSLRWHYRSRHDSLISYSNGEFYANELVVFPCAHREHAELGVHVVYEPEDWYDRGRSGTNRNQARRIARAVFEHAQAFPDKSLGVGAFSQRQQQAILDEIEILRRQDESLESFFSAEEDEPFFVKNLETIQGDERDIIFLSLGYGKTGPADRLSMNFGPLNREGGWRRLNVLITRAKEKCVVFTSIRPEDFALLATEARGAHALHGYLHYAFHGRLPQITGGDGEFGSDFERAVYAKLREHDYEVHRQVGCVGYAIDLAIVDPENPGEYLLGIECDGATYHSTATARDRDRLRQQVLQDLGWRIHRVWSTDWYHTPQKELQRMLDAIENARSRSSPIRTQSGVSVDESVDLSEQLTQVEHGLEGGGFAEYEPYVPRPRGASDAFYVPSRDIRSEVVACVEVEGPIHEDELVRRVAGAWGISRVGSRVREAGLGAITSCLRGRRIARRGRFLWPNGVDDPKVRRRGKGAPRDPKLICPEEFGRAAGLMLKAQYGMSLDDLIKQTAYALGFSSAGTRISEAIRAAVAPQIEEGRIVENDGLLHVGSAPG